MSICTLEPIQNFQLFWCQEAFVKDDITLAPHLEIVQGMNHQDGLIQKARVDSKFGVLFLFLKKLSFLQ